MTTELNQTDNDWGDAHLLALRNQMADAGLVVQTVAEGVLILIDTLKNHGIEIKLSDDRHNRGVLGA